MDWVNTYMIFFTENLHLIPEIIHRLSTIMLHIDIWQNRMFQLCKQCDLRDAPVQISRSTLHRWQPEYVGVVKLYTYLVHSRYGESCRSQSLSHTYASCDPFRKIKCESYIFIKKSFMVILPPCLFIIHFFIMPLWYITFFELLENEKIKEMTGEWTVSRWKHHFFI